MCHSIIRVVKLLRDIYVLVLIPHAKRELKAFFDGFSDITGIVDEFDLRAVVAYQLCPFLTYGIRHDDDRPISLHRADQSQTNPLISAGRLDDGCFSRFNLTIFLRLFNHIQRCSGLDGTSHIHPLVFYKHFRTGAVRQSPETDHGGFSYCFQDIIVNHGFLS